MLIDPVPLLSQSFITHLVSMMTMKWTGLFYTIFIFYQELDLYKILFRILWLSLEMNSVYDVAF